MYIEEANECEIENIIRELKNTTATGKDNIQTEHMKKTGQTIAKAICKLINRIIETEIWPDNLKIQIIRPVYKKSNKREIGNYRPIALLSIIDKIIEKFFANKINKFFEKFKILSDIQYGYSKGKSTTQLLINLNEIVTKSLNEGKYVGIVLVDLQKAFDTFDKKILLQKCRKIGLRGKIYNIIESYLDNRKTQVRICGEESEYNEINYGVPQGSVLGPLLYLIYTNDISDIELRFFFLQTIQL